MSEVLQFILKSVHESDSHPLMLPWIFVPLALAVVSALAGASILRSSVKAKHEDSREGPWLGLVGALVLAIAGFFAFLALLNSGSFTRL